MTLGCNEEPRPICISKEPAARLSGKLSRNWLIMLVKEVVVTLATPISSHEKDKIRIPARPSNIVYVFFFKHLRGPDASILEFDWLNIPT